MNLETYKLRYIPTGQIEEWTLDQILEEINRDRSDDWQAYDKNDWFEAVKDRWIEYELVDPDILTKDQRIKRTRKVARVILDYTPGEDAREAFIDLLTDALHLFGEEQVRFHLDWALEHYHAETSDEVLAS
jgi:hypothetical protein